MNQLFSPNVSGRLHDEVLLVIIDNPPVNAASAAMRAGLDAAIRHAAETDAITAMVITGAGRNFVGGADIREFGAPMAEPTLPQIIERMEASDKPIVAAINARHSAAAWSWRSAAITALRRPKPGSACPK